MPPTPQQRAAIGHPSESTFEPFTIPEGLTPSQTIEWARRRNLPEGLRARDGVPQAEFRELSPAQQPLVNLELRARVQAQVDARNLPPAERARLQPLIDAIGTPDFYARVAELDPARARAWREMAGVQQQFAAAEPGYDAQTRAYSESMRLTLHASAVLHLANPQARGGADLYSHFIRLHTTAFDQNGGSVTNNQIGVRGSANVLWNTPGRMALNAHNLARGLFQSTDPLTAQAAELTRHSRWAVLNGAYDGL